MGSKSSRSVDMAGRGHLYDCEQRDTNGGWKTVRCREISKVVGMPNWNLKDVYAKLDGSRWVKDRDGKLTERVTLIYDLPPVIYKPDECRKIWDGGDGKFYTREDDKDRQIIYIEPSEDSTTPCPDEVKGENLLGLFPGADATPYRKCLLCDLEFKGK